MKIIHNRVIKNKEFINDSSLNTVNGSSFVHAIICAMIATIASFMLYSFTVEPEEYNTSDNYWYVPTSQCLLADGTFDLSGRYKDVINRVKSWNWMVVQVHGGWYNYFAPGTSLVILPVVAVGNIVYGDTSGIDCDFKIAALAARVLAALSTGLMLFVVWLITRKMSLSIAAAAILALSTPHLSIHAGGLWSHNAVLLLELAALGALFAGGRWAPFSIFPLALAFYCRPTAAIPIALTFGFFLQQKRWKDAMIFGGFGLILLAIMAWSWHSSRGVLLPSYFNGDNYAYSIQTRGLRLGRMAVAFAGHLVSPNRGLFVFMPIALFSVIGWVSSFRRLTPSYKIFRLMGFWIIGHWLLITTYPHWWLGHSFGPRAFVEMTAPLVLLLIPWWENLPRQPMIRRALVTAAICLIMIGSFINMRGAFLHGPRSWNVQPANVDEYPQRIWFWCDLQFMRRN